MPLQQSPYAGMHAHNERNYRSNGAHWKYNHTGRKNSGPNLSPRFDRG